MDQTPWPDGRRVLQLPDGGGFHGARAGHWFPGLAIPTRGSETERHLVAALGVRVRRNRHDLDHVVDAISGTAAGRGAAELSPGHGDDGGHSPRADRTPRRLSKWREWGRVMVRNCPQEYLYHT